MRSIAKAIFKRFQIDNLVHVSVVNPKRSRDNHNATEMGTKWKDKNTEEIHVLEVQCQDQSHISFQEWISIHLNATLVLQEL
jgi:hypothetical protein